MKIRQPTADEALRSLQSGPTVLSADQAARQLIEFGPKAKHQFGDWPTYLGTNSEARHSKYVSRIGNLTLFAGVLNICASNNPYERKKSAYLDAAIKITNTLPLEYPQFKFTNVEKRSGILTELAVEMWPISYRSNFASEFHDKSFLAAGGFAGPHCSFVVCSDVCYCADAET